MRIQNFSLSNQRAIRLAACGCVPPVMMITGPNGCGKSTLLNSLRQAPGGPGPILYIGPHRTSRRQSVRLRFLSQQKIEMGKLLAAPTLPGYEGITTSSNQRDAWNFDEAQSFLKFSLCNIEIDRSEAITKRYDKDGIISRKSMPDVWNPLREMTRNLLPHLEFERIDTRNRDQILCLWRAHNKDVHVDIDDLSSGEKAIIQLFFPLIERQIQSNISKISGDADAHTEENIAVLLDEPELHLHPNLQGKVLDYIRDVTLKTSTQFIIATHSPTMVEQANSDELYLLRPAEVLESDTNQLVRIATDEERLRALRETFGSVSNITALRRILVVEGRSATQNSKRASDGKVYGFLSEKFGQITVVSGGGKNECLSLVERLSEALQGVAPELNATALLDFDVGQEAKAEHAVFLPVSMIENLLVDPEVIWIALSVVRHKLHLESANSVATELNSILDSLEDHEIGRRVKAAFASKTFRLCDPVSEAQKQVEDFTRRLLEDLSDKNISSAVSSAAGIVEEISKEKRRREYFDGKLILDKFYRMHVHHTGMSKEIFIYSCAKEASKRRSVTAFVKALFSTIGIEDLNSTASSPE